MSSASGCVEYNWGEPERGVYFGRRGGNYSGEWRYGGERDRGGDCGVGYVFGDCNGLDTDGAGRGGGV